MIFNRMFLSFFPSGVGANLSVWLPWEMAEDMQAGSGQASVGLLRHPERISYPAPVLTATTLRLNSSESVTLSQDEGYSFVNVPGGGDSYWLVFSGQFGPFPDLVSVDYRNENETFACAFTADQNGFVGSITDTEIICRTATGEPEGTYFIVVTVGGQPSEASVDQLIFPAVPIITSIEGCATNQDQGTADCPTVGGISISIYGRNLQAGLVIS